MYFITLWGLRSRSLQRGSLPHDPYYHTNLRYLNIDGSRTGPPYFLASHTDHAGLICQPCAMNKTAILCPFDFMKYKPRLCSIGTSDFLTLQFPIICARSYLTLSNLSEMQYLRLTISMQVSFILVLNINTYLSGYTYHIKIISR